LECAAAEESQSNFANSQIVLSPNCAFNVLINERGLCICAQKKKKKKNACACQQMMRVRYKKRVRTQLKMQATKSVCCADDRNVNGMSVRLLAGEKMQQPREMVGLVFVSACAQRQLRSSCHTCNGFAADAPRESELTASLVCVTMRYMRCSVFVV
jgi:hypothetical protein